MTKEQRKAYMKAYYQAHKDQVKAANKAWHEAHKEQRKATNKAWLEAHREEYKAYMKAYYQAHKDQVKASKKAYYEAHKEHFNAYMKAYHEAHREECKVYAKAYNKADVNSKGQTKNSIRIKSLRILKQMNLHIDGYEIHHCFGYEDPSKFIYISKSLHLKIHKYLRNNNIDASTDHWMLIRDIVNDTDEFTYIKC